MYKYFSKFKTYTIRFLIKVQLFVQLVDKVKTVGLEKQVPILPTPPRHAEDDVVMYHWMGTDERNMFVGTTNLKTIAREKITPFGHLVSWNICTIFPDGQEQQFLVNIISDFYITSNIILKEFLAILTKFYFESQFFETCLILIIPSDNI